MDIAKKITLTGKQIDMLLEKQSILLPDNHILQHHDGQLILNNDGNIYWGEEVDILFRYKTIEHKFVIDDIKKLVCEHLNLCPAEVIFSSRNGGCFDFIIKFDSKNEWNIVVCDLQTAVQNTEQMYDEVSPVNYDAKVIGLYRRLGDSPYFFRWFND